MTGDRSKIAVWCMYGRHFQQRMDQPGMVANPARGELSRENDLVCGF